MSDIVTAAVFEGRSGELRLCEFPRPVPVGPEVLVSVEGTTICGSDAHTVHGRRAVAVPMIAGHEIVGRILSFGPEAPLHDIGGRELNIGDRITWAIVANCGQCFFCERGLPQKCLRGIKYGHEVLSSGRELYGGLATHCLLAEGTSIIRVPEALSLAEACPASCATATVFAALEAAGPVTGRSVCIFGAGMLGLTACAAVRTLGAENVVCVDPAAERRQSAMLFGATQSVTPEEVRAVPGTMRARCAHGGERPSEATDRLRAEAQNWGVGTAHVREYEKSPAGSNGFDIVLELSGSPAACESGFALLQTGGKLILVGAVFPTPAISMIPEQIVRRHISIHGIHNYAPRHLEAALRFLESTHRQFPFGQLVGSWIPLREVNQAFRSISDPGTIRIGIVPEEVPD